MSAYDIDRLAKAMPLITDNGVNEALTLGMFWDSPQMTEQAKDGYRAQVRAILREARDPSEEMEFIAELDTERHDVVKVWETMIDVLMAD